ncbi:MAG: TIGR02688 family protein, partial [Nitrospiraceae bacterium]|nr:TIGR02688 family protein [Nitrospiraceae bacterium]
MNMLDAKIRETFPGESVYKAPEMYSLFTGKNLPSFIKDWLVSRFTDEEEDLSIFLNRHIPHTNSQLKGNLINDGESVTLLSRVIIEPDVKTGILRFSIPDIGIKLNEGRIPTHIAKKYSELKGGEAWGVVTLNYEPPREKEKGIIEITEYTPFKPYEVDLEYYRSVRNEYSLEEWVDLL